MRPGVLARHGYLAGDDPRRREELAAAMLDHEVKAIVAARGGYGAIRILDGLPWSSLAERPKWIVGHSDVTALHAMAWASGLSTVHAPNATGLGRGASVQTRAAWLAALERPRSATTWRGLRVLHAGNATGPVVGGNLSLLHSMAAAGRLVVPPSCVVAVEDVNEAPYRVDRMLTSLLLGRHLDRASAIVFGSFSRCHPSPDGTAIDDVLEACTRPLGIPVLAGAPFGHGDRNDAFVLGSNVSVHHGEVTWHLPRPA